MGRGVSYGLGIGKIGFWSSGAVGERWYHITQAVQQLPSPSDSPLVRLTVKEADPPISPVDGFPLAVVLGYNSAHAVNHVL